MRALHWGWLLVAAIPGCVLIQPLDSAVSSSDGGDTSSSAGAGAGAHAGASAAGGSSSHAGAPGSRAGAPGVSGGASGGATSVGKLAPFLGTWGITSGTLTISCPGTAPSSSPATGTEVWAPGTISDLIQPAFQGDCGDLYANVSARTATALPGQTCTESSVDNTSGDEITQDLTLQVYRFIVSADGKSATETFSGTDDYTDVTTGGALTCMFSQTATLTK